MLAEKGKMSDPVGNRSQICRSESSYVVPILTELSRVLGREKKQEYLHFYTIESEERSVFMTEWERVKGLKLWWW